MPRKAGRAKPPSPATYPRGRVPRSELPESRSQIVAPGRQGHLAGRVAPSPNVGQQRWLPRAAPASPDTPMDNVSSMRLGPGCGAGKARSRVSEHLCPQSRFAQGHAPRAHGRTSRPGPAASTPGACRQGEGWILIAVRSRTGPFPASRRGQLPIAKGAWCPLGFSGKGKSRPSRIPEGRAGAHCRNVCRRPSVGTELN